jgi:outer membrane protein assembly factor BamE (lipoprotein component of BamABCDE complex)
MISKASDQTKLMSEQENEVHETKTSHAMSTLRRFYHPLSGRFAAGPGKQNVAAQMKTNCRSVILILFAMELWSFTGCVSKRSEMGVRNYWRAPSPPAFEKGQTTQSDVMRALGPPSQVIALQDQTLFYYLREQSRTKAAILLVYNRTREEILYDRAIFFFNKQSVLTDFAYSPEAIQLEK